MARDRVFRDQGGYLARSPGSFRKLGPDRVFLQEHPTQASKEVGPGDPELLLRQVPGQPRQRRWYARGIDRLSGIALGPLVGAPGDEVPGMGAAPCLLIAAPAFPLALGPLTRDLSITKSWMRREATPTNDAPPLPPSRGGHPPLFSDRGAARGAGPLLASRPRSVLASA
jgi:hypothetical protein